MTNEREYRLGSRSAYLAMLRECLRQLGHDPAANRTRWALEREEAIQVLRRVCEEHGDNNWAETLHLGDIIDKHLGRHLDGRP